MISGSAMGALLRLGMGPAMVRPALSAFSNASISSLVSFTPCSFQTCFSMDRRYLNARLSQCGQGTATLSAGAIGPPFRMASYSCFIFSTSDADQHTSLFPAASRRSSSSISPSASSSSSSSSSPAPWPSFLSSASAGPLVASVISTSLGSLGGRTAFGSASAASDFFSPSSLGASPPSCFSLGS